MNTRRFLAVAAVLAVATAGLAVRAGVPAAAEGRPQDAGAREDQVDLAVTVYNSNLALIRDIREFTLRRASRTCTSSTSRPRSTRRPSTSVR